MNRIHARRFLFWALMAIAPALSAQSYQMHLDSAGQYPLGSPPHLAWLEKALESSRQSQSYEGIVQTLGRQALHYYMTDENAALLAATDAADSIARQHLTPQHPARTNSAMARFLYADYNRLPQVIELGDAVLAIAPKGYPYESDVWDRVLRLLFQRQDISEGQRRLQVLDARITARRSSPSMRVLWLEGKMRESLKLHQYERAAKYGEMCLSANDTFAYYVSTSLGPICVEIGKAWAAINRPVQALEWMEKGLAYAGVTQEDPVAGGYLINIGKVYASQENHSRALSYFNQALDLYLAHPRYRSSLGILYQLIGLSLRELGREEEAYQATSQSLQYLQDYSIQLLHHSLDSKNHTLSTRLQAVQDVIADIAQLDDLPLTSEGLPATATSSHPYWLALALNNKATLLLRQANVRQDTAYIKQALAALNISDYYHFEALKQSAGARRSQLGYLEWVHDNWLIRTTAYNDWYNIAPTPQVKSELLNAVEQCHVLQLADAAALNHQSVTYQRLSKEKYQLERAIAFNDATTHALPPHIAQRLITIYDSLKSMSNLQQVTPPNHAHSLENDLQQQLQPDEHIIYFTHFDNAQAITVVNQSGIHFGFHKHPFATQRAILNDIATVKALLNSPLISQRSKKATFVAAAHRLYQHFIAPIVAQIAPGDHLIIIPDARYNDFPFEVLLPSGTTDEWASLDFLVRQHPISYHHSGALWLKSAQAPSITNSSLLGVAPSFEQAPTLPQVYWASNSASSGYRSLQEGRLKPLSSAQQEVKDIDAILPTTGDLLLGNQALKNNIINKIDGSAYQYIHIATHGLILPEQPELSALACTPAASQQYDDLLLFMDDIDLLDIQADLVVLGSCESGIGQNFSGSTPLSLSRAFLQAGARNAIHTTIKINDKYSSKLFVKFYQAQTAHPQASYAHALQQAKRYMLSDNLLANPRYWAPILLIGQ